MSNGYHDGVQFIEDLAADSSDKIITPAGSLASRLLWAHVGLTTTASVGNRQMILQVRDADDTEVYNVYAGAVQAASLIRRYSWFPGSTREADFVPSATVLGDVIAAIPTDLILLPGWSIRIADDFAVDSAADDMQVRVMLENLPRVN